MQQTVELPQVQHTESIVDGVVNLPVAVRDHVPMVQTAQNTVEVPQAHHTVVMQRQCQPSRLRINDKCQ